MGGRGSGWWGGHGRPQRRPVVEEASATLCAHAWRRASIERGEGALLGMPRRAAVTIAGQWHAVQIEPQVHPLYAGARWWFRCPCGRRCARLYVFGDLPPACRRCAGASYESRRSWDRRVTEYRRDPSRLAGDLRGFAAGRISLAGAKLAMRVAGVL
jgi:hypothetical protein